MSEDANPLLRDLADRLSAMSAAPDALTWSVTEMVEHCFAPIRVAAAVKGTRQQTLVLDAGGIWVWMRVKHWIDGARWELAPVESRVRALREALRFATCGTPSELHARAAEWAETQTDYTGKGGFVIMLMSDWGLLGSARQLLAEFDAYLQHS